MKKVILKLNLIILIFAFWLACILLLTSCMPNAEPQIQVVERHCHFVQLEPKPNLPTITWLDCGGMRCLDEMGYQSLKQRDAMLRTYADYLITVYDDTRLRCSE